MTQFSGYIGNTPAPRGTEILTQGILPQPTDYINVPGGYTVGAVKLFINGLRINGEHFNADDGVSVKFNQTYDTGTRYVIEHIRQFEVFYEGHLADLIGTSSGDDSSDGPSTPVGISFIEPRIYHIRYTSDLWSESHVDMSALNIDDMFISRFFDGTRQLGSGGFWNVISLTATAPDDTDGLNSDGYLYSWYGGYYRKFALVSDQCTPLHYGKNTPIMKNIYQVRGGFHGQTLILGGFFEIGDQGGGTFIWDEHKSKLSHDGGTIIDPDKGINLVSGNVDPDYLIPNSVGSGCWVRLYTGDTDPKWFGDFS